MMMTRIAEDLLKSSEDNFYGSYGWCLNPFRPLRDLFDLLDTELSKIPNITEPWQQEESRINLHIFVGAITCIVEDYLSWLPWRFQPLKKIFPRLPIPVSLLDGFFNFPYSLWTFQQRKAAQRWRIDWTTYVNEITRIVLTREVVTETKAKSLAKKLKEFREAGLPEELLRRRLRIVEGYRCHDLTHHDIVTLANRFAQSHPDREADVFIIGIRTAGSYYAPMVYGRLQELGYSHLSWIATRPKNGLSEWERKEIIRRIKPGTRIALVDDYANTGYTFRLLQQMLCDFGATRSQITLLAPVHPRYPDALFTTFPETEVIKLVHEDLYKTELVAENRMTPILRSYVMERYGTDCDFSIVESDQTNEINKRFWKDTGNSSMVRTKKVFEIKFLKSDRSPVTTRILAKSAGWGWFGYHAFIVGRKLDGSVPRIIGLHQGILFEEWLESGNDTVGQLEKEKWSSHFGTYAGQRLRLLPLNEDPRMFGPEYGWGWMEIIALLRRPYGIRPGYLKHPALRKHLFPHGSPVPTYIDGRMMPEDWIATGQGLKKTDFELHGFGEPNQEIVDPAFDLAGAVFEFHLTEQEEHRMVESYIRESNDHDVADRLVLHKLLYGNVAKRLAREDVVLKNCPQPPDYNHRRYAWSWDFLVFTMNRYCASLILPMQPAQHSKGIFFLDLDGVFDTLVLGFPHTTPVGVTALALLQRGGYSVIPNTGRSIEHVRQYCKSYGFQGGIGEYGSVIFDAKKETVIPLIREKTSRQIDICRSILEKLPGVFLDPSYRFSLRAYRFDGSEAFGLDAGDMQRILDENNCDCLSFISQENETYVVDKEVDKGRAAKKYCDLIGYDGTMIAGMGNSDEDIPMLDFVNFRFAPKNCSDKIRSRAHTGWCTITGMPFQRGLLTAVQALLAGEKLPAAEELLTTGPENSLKHVLYQILQRADQSMIQRALALARINSL